MCLQIYTKFKKNKIHPIVLTTNNSAEFKVPQVDRQVIRRLFLLCKDPHKGDPANMLSGPRACGSMAGLLC